MLVFAKTGYINSGTGLLYFIMFLSTVGDGCGRLLVLIVGGGCGVCCWGVVGCRVLTVDWLVSLTVVDVGSCVGC